MSDVKPVVLMLDDDRDVLKAVGAILRDEPYEFEAYSSSAEAEAAIAERAPDLMIVDLMMEELDTGAEFVRKARDKGVAAPTYMLSSVGDELNRSTDCKSLGLDGVIQKPVDAKSLLSILRARLRNKNATAS